MKRIKDIITENYKKLALNIKKNKKIYIEILCHLLLFTFIKYLMSAADVPHYHTDVFYILYLLGVLFLGILWSIINPNLLIHAIIVFIFWNLMYLINSLKYGFYLEGYITRFSYGIFWVIIFFFLNVIFVAIKKRISSNE